MKSRNLITAIALTVVGLSVQNLFSSCKRAGEKTGEKAIENAIEQSTGKDADINLKDETAEVTINGEKVKFDGTVKSWPKEIPADIPEFKYGKIEGLTISDLEGGVGYTLNLSDLSADALKAYDKDLKAKGFETNFITIEDKGGTITAEKDNISVVLMGGEGNGSLSVQISKK